MSNNYCPFPILTQASLESAMENKVAYDALKVELVNQYSTSYAKT